MHKGQESLPAAPQAKDKMRVTIIATAAEVRAENRRNEEQRVREKRLANSKKAEAKGRRLTKAKLKKKSR
jgi:hypothetical protein